MRYVFVDDSIPYDGYTPSRRPLGGPEKAVISLASALQLRGHDVHVVNHVAYAHMADGAYYTPFGDALQAKTADVLIAVRKPALLGTLRAAKRRMLWVMGATDYLNAPVNQTFWNSFAPSLLFISPAQRGTYGGALQSLVMPPGVRSPFLLPAETPPENEAAFMPPPHAVVTTHPLHGLSWLLDLWTNDIHPQLPTARLSVYSAVLTKGLKGEEVPADIAPVLAKVKAAANHNVVVIEPRHDEGMAEVYRASRVHLYPGNGQDYACWTLAESQATGLPAVARGLGGTEERIVNGESGYIVPDASAFANVALQILTNDAVYRNLGAGGVTRHQPWSTAAEMLDEFVAALPEAAS